MNSNKTLKFRPEQLKIKSKLILKDNLTIDGEKSSSTFLPAQLNKASKNRVNEFLRGRYCAGQALELMERDAELLIDMNNDRSPAWPSGIVGSISHSKRYSCSAVTDSDRCIGLGIDVELVSRVQDKISRVIKTNQDINENSDLSAQELLALIFSAKESLYKSLYPLVQQFFGFDHAALVEINNGIFTIELLKELTAEYPMGTRFEGSYQFFDDHIFTIIEINL